VRTVSRLQHPSVFRFLGFVITEPGSGVDESIVETPWDIGIVYPWVDLNLQEYLELKKDINRCYLVSLARL
jgi:hypothetical protein